MADPVDLDALDRLIAAATPGPWTSAELREKRDDARAALDRRVVELLERLLRGEHDSAGLGPVRSRPAQAERVEKFEAECRALLAEIKKETPHA